MFAIVALPTKARNLDKIYQKAQLQVGRVKFTAYIADDEAKRSQGLMFIEKLPDDVGMLFVFDQQQPLGFWMKNTLIPLNIGFFDERAELIDTQEMQVAPSVMDLNPPTYQSRGAALFALEMNAGWFKKHGVNKGARLRLVGPFPSPRLARKLNLFHSAKP